MTKRALVIGIDRYDVLQRPLRGAVNDARTYARLLAERFGFEVRALLDLEATRDAVLAAWATLVAETQPGDVVVVTYAGHGSRIHLPGGETRESLVPTDSGRTPHPNRDVLDLEFDAFVRELNRKTDLVTLILDCCHSGSVSRDVFGDAAREVEPDYRLPEGYVPEPTHEATRSLDAGESGWPGERSASVLAACAASELAYELTRDGVHHGAFTFHLAAELALAGETATWRDLFDMVAARVVADRDRQHPLFEGRRDVRLFGGAVAPPQTYVLVVEVKGAEVKLEGGAVHGLLAGAELAVHPPMTPAPTGEPLARLRVTFVRALDSTATFLTQIVALPAQARAFLDRTPVSAALTFRVEGDEREAMQAALETSRLLAVPAAAGAEPEVLVRLLPRRNAEEAARGAFPHLGPLDKSTWAAVGRDGRLAARLRPADRSARGLLREDLERAARARALRALDNPRSGLRGLFTLRVLHAAGTAPLQPAEPDTVLVPGDRVELELVNDANRDLYVTVLQVGSDGRVDVVYPSGESARLAPRRPFRIAAEHFGRPEGLAVELPEGFPYAAEPGEDMDEGYFVVKALVTTRPASFEALAQERARGLDRGAPDAVEDLERLVATWVGDPDEPVGTSRFLAVPKGTGGEDWAVVTRVLRIARTRPSRERDAPSSMDLAPSRGDGARDAKASSGEFMKSLPDFFKMVASGLVDAQRSLDDQATIYNRDQPEHPKRFVIPKLTAKIAANFATEGTSGLNLIFLKNTELTSDTRSQEVQFTIEAVDAPPERKGTPAKPGGGFPPNGAGGPGVRPPWQPVTNGTGHLELPALEKSPDQETRLLAGELARLQNAICLELGPNLVVIRGARADGRVEVYAITKGDLIEERRITRIRAPGAR